MTRALISANNRRNLPQIPFDPFFNCSTAVQLKNAELTSMWKIMRAMVASFLGFRLSSFLVLILVVCIYILSVSYFNIESALVSITSVNEKKAVKNPIS